MDLTLDEKQRGILILTDMTYDDFLRVIDAKIDELNHKVKEYIPAATEDIKQVRNVTSHEIDVTIELHKSYVASLKGTLEDLREICKKSLHKDYMVPTLIIETYVDLARKVCTLKYVKLQPTHERIAG